MSYEYSNDDWNNKGILLLADAYMAKGDDADAQVILESLIESKAKQEYLDEANKRLEAIKAKQAAKEAAEKKISYEEMKIKFNQTNKDENIMQEIKFEAEGATTPTDTTTTKQPN